MWDLGLHVKLTSVAYCAAIYLFSGMLYLLLPGSYSQQRILDGIMLHRRTWNGLCFIFLFALPVAACHIYLFIATICLMLFVQL
jgi:hypothetical protein